MIYGEFETMPSMKTLCWIRRDLRLHDHAALSHALKSGETTLVFVFDEHILKQLPVQDKRLTFIIQSLQEIEKALQKKNSSLIILHGKPEEVLTKLALELKVNQVLCNRDYEPYAKKRDTLVAKNLKAQGIAFEQFKDHVIYEKHEVLTGSRAIYKVFTPYKNKWLEEFSGQGQNLPLYECPLKNLRSFKNPDNILDQNWHQKLGFKEDLPSLIGGTSQALKLLKNFHDSLSDYATARNYPAQPGTSLLSVYIRHGCLSIRDMVKEALSSKSEGAKTWLSELIWRDFYQMILDSHPGLEKVAFKPEYDFIKWKGKEQDFEAWCRGETGFPIVDAAMRCLNTTGMMHNRLRMITASFLCKILLVDWRKGEKYFALKLLDFDLAANNGGWQWSSSSGCDAQPYFRIFNPYTQSEKFDAKGEFIKVWVPELSTVDAKSIHRPSPGIYLPPIVNYETNRMRCLEMYSIVKNASHK
jgi:deoxyribodipyrimidine photo-lyase